MENSLSEKISHLRSYIEETEGLTPENRTKLLETIADLESAVPEDGPDHRPPLQKLEDSMLELEAEHPRATQLLEGICNILGRMGI
jgi:hypothetical protein